MTAEAERQYKEVEAKYKGTDTWLKAPNGKASNLNERQWVQVRTPAFKAWFGDWENDPKNASKVVDENGEPMVVYHGSPSKKGFFTFEIPETGAFFTKSPELVKTYSGKGGTVYEVFLNIKNPMSADIEGGYWGDVSKAKVNDTSWTIEKLFGYNNSYTSALAKQIRQSGFDGAWLKNIYDIGPKQAAKASKMPTDVFFLHSPAQIKSATANVGTFSAENPDIRYKKLREPASLTEKQKELISWADAIWDYYLPKTSNQARPEIVAKQRNLDKDVPYKKEEFAKATEVLNSDPLYAAIKGVVSAKYDSPAEVEEAVLRLVNSARRHGPNQSLYLMNKYDPEGARRVADLVESYNKPENRDQRVRTYNQEEAEEDARAILQKFEGEAKLTLAEARRLGDDGFTMYLLGLGKKLQGEDALENFKMLLEIEKQQRDAGITDAAIEDAKRLELRNAQESLVQWRRMLRNAARMLSHEGKTAKDALPRYRAELELMAANRSRTMQEMENLEKQIGELDKEISEMSAEIEELAELLKQRGMFKIAPSEMNREGYTSRVALLEAMQERQRTARELLRKMSDTLKASDEYAQEVETEAKRLEKKGGKLTPKTMPKGDMSWDDWVKSAWYNFILSSPVTHSVNMGANAVNAALEELASTITEPLTALQSLKGAALSVKDLGSAAKAWYLSIFYPKTFQERYENALTDPKLSDKQRQINARIYDAMKSISHKYEINSAHKVLYDSILNFNNSLMSAEDLAFYLGNYRMHLPTIAAYFARTYNKINAKKGIPKRYTWRELAENPTVEMMEIMNYEATRATFNQNPEGLMGGIVNGVQSAYRILENSGPAGKAVSIALRVLVMPFTRIVGNISNAAIDWSPLGFIRAGFYAADTKFVVKQTKLSAEAWNLYKQRMIAMQVTRSALGTILGLMLYMMLMGDDDDDEGNFGSVTGPGSSSRTMQSQLEQSGFVRYAKRIAGRYVPYLDTPLAMPLAFAGYMNDYLRYNQKETDTPNERWSYAALGMGRTLLDKSFLSEMKSGMLALAIGQESYFTRKTAGIIPRFGMVSLIDKMIDPTAYKAETLAQYASLQIPLIHGKPRESVPVQVGLYGQPKTTDPLLRLRGMRAAVKNEVQVADKMGELHDMRELTGKLTAAGLQIPYNTSYRISTGDKREIRLTSNVDKSAYQAYIQQDLGLRMLSRSEEIKAKLAATDYSGVDAILKDMMEEARKKTKQEFLRRWKNNELVKTYNEYSTDKYKPTGETQ